MPRVMLGSYQLGQLETGLSKFGQANHVKDQFKLENAK